MVYQTHGWDDIESGVLADQDMQILYKVATVFPTPGVMQNGSPAPSYTFAAGSYEYPFQFKVNMMYYDSLDPF